MPNGNKCRSANIYFSQVDWDYEDQNPTRGNKLLTEWDDFVEKLLVHATKIDIGDRSGRALLEKIRQVSMSKCKNVFFLSLIYSEQFLFILGSRNYQVFKLIPTVLKPKRIGKRKLPTIIDAQNDHVVHVYTANDIGPVIERAKADRDPYQPTIIVVGPTDTELEQFYVFKGGVFWKLCSFLRCIDVVAKSTVVFDLQFSPANELFWAFLRTYFFKETGVVHSKSGSIISLLKSLK